MWIVKLGGSLLGASALKQWLKIITHYSDGRIIIVPGGGIFADAVRTAQQLSHMHDKVAHRLALLAMDQYGELLASLNPDLVTASSELEIAERSFQHRAIIWLPSQMVCADETIPANWQVTSDSLAAWLATKLNAEHLVLVKSLSFERYRVKTQQNLTINPANQISIQTLIKDDVVDGCFADFIKHKHFNTWLLSKDDYTIFEQGMDANKLSASALVVKALD